MPNLLLLLREIQLKENKFSIAMVVEIIDFYCFGMGLLLMGINMIVFLLEFGVRLLRWKQGDWYMQNIWHKSNGKNGFLLVIVAMLSPNYLMNLDWN